MTRIFCQALPHRGQPLSALRQVALVVVVALLGWSPWVGAQDAPKPSSRAGAARTAADTLPGVLATELVADAPERYTVKPTDTLLELSRRYLKNPWRWAQLWGMSAEGARDPQLIMPGQVLVLDKTGPRIKLSVVQSPATEVTEKLSPRVRSSGFTSGPIPSIPFQVIEPFLNEAVIVQANELDQAPRIVAAQEGRVMLSTGDLAYVRGAIAGQREYRIFREPRPLRDPSTSKVLGYEAKYVGVAEYVREGQELGGGKDEIIPATFAITRTRLEAGAGDKLVPIPVREFSNYAPHPPAGELTGQIVSIYGDGLAAGQNQIVTLNRGKQDGVERGHVFALWQDGAQRTDGTDPRRSKLKLPDERHGLLFVFRVFDSMSYALILTVRDPVRAGDDFTQP